MLPAVHDKLDATINDLKGKPDSVNKRLRYKLDGSKLLKVFLDAKDRNTSEYKLETFAECYRKLSGHAVVFDYPSSA